MSEKESTRPVRGGRDRSLEQARGTRMSQQLLQGIAFYRNFKRFRPSRVMRVCYPRVIPPIVVELGELVGLIYRSDKGQSGWPRAYIHVMQDPPRLVSNVDGTQLYIVGGSYRVTRRGIEG